MCPTGLEVTAGNETPTLNGQSVNVDFTLKKGEDDCLYPNEAIAHEKVYGTFDIARRKESATEWQIEISEAQ